MRLIDGDILVMLLTDWWYASFGQTETQESKAIKAVLDQVKIHVEKHECKPCEVGTQMSLPSHEDAILKEIATKLAEEIKENLIITDFSGNTRTITAAKAAPNVPAMPPVYAVSADDVIENMEAELADKNVGDAVSRQAVIDCFWNKERYFRDALDVIKDIRRLPSAQPEVIRCKDCKWYGRTDKRRFYRGMDCLKKRMDTIVPDKDFCSRAERRTDE